MEKNPEIEACIKVLRDRRPENTTRPMVPGALDFLREGLSPREEAALKLGEIGDNSAVKPLLDIVKSESEAEMRSTALAALANIGGRRGLASNEVREGIKEAFRNGDESLREMILSKLGKYGPLRDLGLSRASFIPSVTEKAEQVSKEGDTYWNKCQWKNALTKWKEAASIDPYNPRIHSKLGRVYIELGNIEEAEKEFEKQLEVDDEDFHSHAILSIIYGARAQSVEERLKALNEERAAMNTPYYREANIRILPDYARRVQDLVRRARTQ